MAAGPREVAHHPWFGQLHWHQHGQDELIGAVPVDPSVRALRDNGGADVEVLIQCEQGARLTEILDRCRGTALVVFNHLTSIREQVAAIAPADWIEQYGPSPGAFADRLFLDGLEFAPTGAVTAVFDVGDLDQLCAAVTDVGQVRSVVVRP